MQTGRKYRINEQGHKADGRVGTLEVVRDGEVWLMVSGKLVRAPAQSITDANVLQGDLTALRTRPEPVELPWEEQERFA